MAGPIGKVKPAAWPMRGVAWCIHELGCMESPLSRLRMTGRTLAGGLVDGPVYERIFSTMTGAGGEPSSVGTRTGMHHFE
jgi:hypothetical protein